MSLRFLKRTSVAPPEWSWQADEAASGPRFGIVAIDAEVAVDPGADAAADGDDFVVVPVAFFHELLAAFGFEEGAAVFFVELAPPAGADVALVAAHQAVFDGGAADLDAAVAFVVA